MGVAKVFCMRLARSDEYERLEKAIVEGRPKKISRYHRMISEKIEELIEDTNRSMHKFGRQPKPEEEKQFYGALRMQAEIHVPAWYHMGDLPPRFLSLSYYSP